MSKSKQAPFTAARAAVIMAAAVMAVALIVDPSFALRDRQASANQAVEQRYLERLRRVMIPLLKATDHPKSVDQVRVQVVADPHINAGSAGAGQFVVTTGLLDKANDEQLRGVLAHEIAHDDLGHPAKMQLLGLGLGVGVALLEKVFPNSAAVAPIARTLLASSYSRPQELAADRHAVTILGRAGYSKSVMINALSWIMHNEGNTGGGFLSTHPATDERIRALKRL